jgi:hypothetical protein
VIGASDPIQDLSDEFFERWVDGMNELDINPLDTARVAFAESGLRATSFHPGSNGGGIIGFMPSTLKGLGWSGTPESFRKLSAADQVPWAVKYYRPYAPYLKSDALVYVANFMPALLKQAASEGPDFVLAAQGGPYAGIYKDNKILDRNNDGKITVDDLSKHLDIQDQGARYQAIEQRLVSMGGSRRSKLVAGVKKHTNLILFAAGIGAFYWYASEKGFPSWFPRSLRF